MLDTGCDFSESNESAVGELHLYNNYMPIRAIVNGSPAQYYEECRFKIGGSNGWNSKIVTTRVYQTIDDDNLIGRDIYNQFDHVVKPKHKIHEWHDN